MKKDYQNKAMGAERTKTEGSEQLQEFHYPGSGIYKPKTVKARTQQEADAIWEKEREEQ